MAASFVSSFSSSFLPPSFTSRRICNTEPPRVYRRRGLVTSPRATAISDNNDVLIDALFDSIRGVDGGPFTPKRKTAEIDSLVNRLVAAGDASGVDYLQDPRLPAQYSLVYTGGGRGNSAAGGAFRSSFGRLFFRPRGVFQHIFKPDIAVNLVAFRLFGFLNGVVGLYGQFSPYAEMGKGGLKVVFIRPRIRLGPFTFLFGDKSQVMLRIAYFDERVRIGVGSRGSLFVFVRDKDADGPVAGEWRSLFGKNVKVRSQESLQFLIGVFVAVVGGVLVSIVTNFVQLFMR